MGRAKRPGPLSLRTNMDILNKHKKYRLAQDVWGSTRRNKVEKPAPLTDPWDSTRAENSQRRSHIGEPAMEGIDKQSPVNVLENSQRRNYAGTGTPESINTPLPTDPQKAAADKAAVAERQANKEGMANVQGKLNNSATKENKASFGGAARAMLLKRYLSGLAGWSGILSNDSRKTGDKIQNPLERDPGVSKEQQTGEQHTEEDTGPNLDRLRKFINRSGKTSADDFVGGMQ
jgi:hypothetical protein